MTLLLLFGGAATPSGSTNIESLPLLYAVSGVGEGDLFLSFAIYEADGVTPLSLTGISFTGGIFSATAMVASLAGQIAVSNSNTITIQVPAATVAAWAPGQYEMSVTASDGSYTRDLFSGALVVIGNPVPPVVKVVWTSGAVVNVVL